jgi:hypothetical protein
MKNIFEKRLDKKITNFDLNRINELFSVLNEELKARLFVGKSLYKDLIKNEELNINESD